MSDQDLRDWVGRMGRKHGFGSSQAKGGEAGEAETINFEEDEEVEVPVHSGDPGIVPEQQIINHLSDFENEVRDYWDSYRDGLNNFVETMDAASNQSAQPQHLKAVFKELGKQALDQALGAVAARMGPWGAVIGVVKGSVEAWLAESDRVSTAEGQVRVRDYVIALRNSIQPQSNTMIRAIEGQQRPLLQEFQRLAQQSGGEGEATADGRVFGEPARLLNEMAAHIQSFKSSVSRMNAQYFQQRFSRDFANTPGLSAPVSQGGIPSGTLYFTIELTVRVGEPPAFVVDDKSDEWNLVTSAPNPDRVADSLRESLDGKKPWEIDLPKMVKLELDIDRPGLDGRQVGYIYFTNSPTSFTVRSNCGDRYFSAIWNTSQIRNLALQARGLTGSSG